jgi:short-subunit dehydrogenase
VHTNKTILITGCSTGIGFDAATQLKKRGYQVIASARKAEDVERLIAQGFTCVQLDLANQTSIESGLQQALKLTDGRLDCLFNNGAYGQAGALEDLPVQALREQFEINVFGWHHLTQQVIKVMRQQGHGRIVQNSSVLGFVCMPYRGAYNASKYAIEGLTDTLRLELANSNIQLSLLEPGPIETDFRKNAAIKFKQWINWQDSVHADNYKIQLERLEKQGAANQFTLMPDAVTRCLIHALESKRPKLRYRITFPTKLFAFLKRFLPNRVIDGLLLKG